jgi:hypothetical protein
MNTIIYVGWLFFCARLVNGQPDFDKQRPSTECDQNAPYSCSFERKDFQPRNKYCNWTLSNAWRLVTSCHSAVGCVSFTDRGSITSSIACPATKGGSSAAPLCLAFWYYFAVTNQNAKNWIHRCSNRIYRPPAAASEPTTNYSRL